MVTVAPVSTRRYNVLMSTVDDKQVYKKLTFQYTVLDEAHLLKNMTSIRFKNLMKIQVILYLTGTASNTLPDRYS